MAQALLDGAAAAGASQPAPALQARPGARPGGVQRAMAQLLVAHDRAIAELADRSTIAVVLKDPAVKDQVVKQRKEWRDAKPSDGSPHPAGCSQRVILFARMVVTMKDTYKQKGDGSQHDARVKTALDYLNNMDGPAIERSVFRLKPKHLDPHADPTRPWVWYLVVAMAAPQEFRDALVIAAAYETKYDNLTVAPAKTEDGPLVKYLVDWLAGKNGDGDDELPGRKHRRTEGGRGGGGGRGRR
ncbi:unnamed protein product [Prorocentrum cordatum]|uniref:Uncharacterized protein n=1 Tax=Prorocentrum cordatum TaxID=2364126 RepID=A0ABN9PDM1_9DINO|nr:unnamed protein product [Polarella glacialis]